VSDSTPSVEAASASTDDSTSGGKDAGRIETGGVAGVGTYDPGPIETDVVMKNLAFNAPDPMAGRDLHLREASRSDAANGGEND
jgi:hypothetical protein